MRRDVQQKPHAELLSFQKKLKRAMMSPDSRQTSLKSSRSNSFAFTNFNSAQQTACFVQKERKSVIFFFYIMCAKACDSWIHTSVLKESRYLVLGGSRDTVEGTQLGQSLHKVSVLSIQGAYSDSCHGKVLEITQKKLWKQRSNEKHFTVLSAGI